jgi:hypothetical protein
MSSKSSKAKRRWYTIAYLTREGAPHPAKRSFEQWYRSETILLDDLSHIMSTEIGHRGAYVAAAWPGQIGEWEALHGKTKPLFYVYQGGKFDRL